MDRSGISRRGALAGASLGLTLPVLAACGDDKPEAGTDGGSPSGRSSAPETPESPTSDPPGESPTKKKPKGDGGIAGTADVPVGSGLILTDQKIVITQPTEGDFKGFTAVCTHRGCTVNTVTDTINCRCHGSMFSIETGEPVGGPAPSPLAEKPLVVRGGAIDLA
jgi:Rieske Fe-S protein